MLLKRFNQLGQEVDEYYKGFTIELYDDGRLRFYRNGKRPLYLTNLSNGSIITSTADVPKRAEVVGVPINLLMNHYNTFDSELTLMIERVDVPMEIDYQHEFS